MNMTSKIPPKLQKDEYRFVKDNGKKPVGKAWNQPENAFKYGNQVLLDWIKTNNYGILHGCGGLIALDADNFPLWQQLGLDKLFEDTFIIQTGRVDEKGNHTGRHYYLECEDLTDKIIKEYKLKTYYKLVDSQGDEIGELRLHHCQTVGPNSIHPSGNRYEVINDMEIKKVSIWDVLDAFEEYIGKKDRTWRLPEKPTNSLKRDHNLIEHSDINIEDLVNIHDLCSHGDEYQGTHPVHGSESGHNFSINPSKNNWYCFRCNSGGGPLELLAVVEGIISCSEAGRGSLRGDKFKQVIKALEQRGHEVPKIKEGKNNLPFTDLGNARRLALDFGDELRYCRQLKSWMVWDGRRWRPDDSGQAERFAKKVVQKMYEAASKIKDESKRKKLANWAFKCESVKSIRDLLISAETEEAFAVILDQFDSDIRYFNLLNGVLDTETLEVLPHDRNRLITKVAGTRYDPKAKCPQWEKFLDEIFGDKKDLIEYVQRVIGYTLTGRLVEQVFFFLYGGGSNGKSTFLNVILALMGDYGKTSDISTFMVKKNEGIRNDLAELAGVRYIMSTEPEAGTEFSMKVIKKWTGNEKIKCRFLHKEYFEYLPQGQLFIAANLKPNIREKTDAPWRRLHLWPFMVKIEKPDVKMEDKLKAELPGILNWAIDGLREYHRIGLKPPIEVLAAVDEYRQEMNTVAFFVKECCEINSKEKLKIMNKDLYRIYCEFCADQGIRPEINNEFIKEIEKLEDVKKGYYNKAIQWGGIRLKSDGEINAGIKPKETKQENLNRT